MNNTEPLKVGDECREAFEREFSDIKHLIGANTYERMFVAFAAGRRTSPSPAGVSSEGLQEEFAKFVIKHIGPNALAGDGISIYDAATLAFSEGANWQASREQVTTDSEIAELIEWLHHRAKYAEQEAEESNRKNERVHIFVSWTTEAKRYRAAASALNQRLAVKKGEARPDIMESVEAFISAAEENRREDVENLTADQLTRYDRTRHALRKAVKELYTHPVSDDQQAKDAARYRWLREGNNEKHQTFAMTLSHNHYGIEWDDLIDAAIAATKQEG